MTTPGLVERHQRQRVGGGEEGAKGLHGARHQSRTNLHSRRYTPGTVHIHYSRYSTKYTRGTVKIQKTPGTTLSSTLQVQYTLHSRYSTHYTPGAVHITLQVQ